MSNWLLMLAGVSLAASACSAPAESKAGKGSAAAEPPRAAAPATQPAPTPGPPASDAIILRDLLAVEGIARKMAAEIYKPEVSAVRQMIGGEKASQSEKAAETFNEVYEKELRRAAHKHGLTYEEARTRVDTARGRPAKP